MKPKARDKTTLQLEDTQRAILTANSAWPAAEEVGREGGREGGRDQTVYRSSVAMPISHT